MTIWFVCPSYFDITSFLKLRTDCLDACAPLRTPLRFLVIDDSAGVDKGTKAVEPLNDVTLISPPLNVGHQRALVLGLRYLSEHCADEDIIVTMDADGEDRPIDIPSMISVLNDAPESIQKVSIARRTTRTTTIKFQVLYVGFLILSRCLTGRVIRSGNFAAYRGILLKNMIFHPLFERCYSATLLALKLDRTFIPCPRGVRYEGKSKMRMTDLIIHGYRMMMPFLDQICIRLMLVVGVVCIALTAIISILLLSYFFSLFVIPNWMFASLVVLLLFGGMLFTNFVVLFTVFSQSQEIRLPQSLRVIVDKNSTSL